MTAIYEFKVFEYFFLLFRLKKLPVLGKAELLQEGIFFPHPFICQRRFSYEKVGTQKTKPTLFISVLKVEY